MACFPELPKVSVHVATGPQRYPDGRRYTSPIIGTGVSDSPAISRMQAIVEGLERYCMLWPTDDSLLVRASAAGLGDRAVAPARFQLFSPEQYRSSPSLYLPSAGEPIDWVWAYSLTAATFKLVPAVLAQASMKRSAPNNLVHAMSSTGVACHVSFAAAVLAGVYEVVERDGLMITWLNRRSPRRVTLDGPAGEELRGMVENSFAIEDVDFILLDMMPDSGIPLIGCVAVSESSDRPALVLGAAARGTAVEAARKALLEAAQILYGLRLSGATAASMAPVSVEVHTIEDHGRYYAGREGANLARFLTESPDSIGIGGIEGIAVGHAEADLRTCVDRLRMRGLEVLVVEITTPDVASCGFRAVKVLIPGTVDINGDSRHPHLGSERIRGMPAALNWPVLPTADLNVAPCPLP